MTPALCVPCGVATASRQVLDSDMHSKSRCCILCWSNRTPAADAYQSSNEPLQSLHHLYQKYGLDAFGVRRAHVVLSPVGRKHADTMPLRRGPRKRIASGARGCRSPSRRPGSTACASAWGPAALSWGRLPTHPWPTGTPQQRARREEALRRYVFAYHRIQLSITTKQCCSSVFTL